MQDIEPARRTRHPVRIILGILLLLAVAGAAFGGAYWWQHAKVNDLNGQVSDLNKNVSSLNSQLKAMAPVECPATPEPTPAPAPTPTPAPAACPDYTYTSGKSVKIIVYAPASGATVASPLGVIGEVPGNWSFEAQFPAVLKDASGATIAQAPATVLGGWQTTELVPFSVQLTYTGSHTGKGTLVLRKDNPSGLSSNDDSVSIPVQF